MAHRLALRLKRLNDRYLPTGAQIEFRISFIEAGTMRIVSEMYILIGGNQAETAACGTASGEKRWEP